MQAGCSLVGGETAEHPGMMPEEDYDLAGFSVGVVDKEKIINREEMQAGDVIIALPSTGVHSNGFSLVRKVFGIGQGGENRAYAELEQPLWETLLTPTRIYVKPVMKLLSQIRPRAISHITGGGFYENIPRSLKEGMTARIEKAAVKTLPIFDIIAREGNIPERDMFNTFNMGVGMTIAVAKADADAALALLREGGEPGAYILGEIVSGEGGVELWERQRCWYLAGEPICRPSWMQRPRGSCPMQRSAWWWPAAPMPMPWCGPKRPGFPAPYCARARKSPSSSMAGS